MLASYSLFTPAGPSIVGVICAMSNVMDRCRVKKVVCCSAGAPLSVGPKLIVICLSPKSPYLAAICSSFLRSGEPGSSLLIASFNALSPSSKCFLYSSHSCLETLHFPHTYKPVGSSYRSGLDSPSSDAHRDCEALWLKLVEVFRTFSWTGV